MTATINASTSSGVVITPDNSGNILLQYNGQSAPAFSAYASVNQTVTDATATKVTFGTEEFDTNNNFSSSRFTPTVAGYYQINATVNCSQSSIVDFVVWIYKNGSQYKRGFGFAGSGPSKLIAPVSGVVYCNGSTDYVEIYVYSDGSGSATVNASSQDTWFDGCLLRGA